jgi:phosphoribosyl 1,2-cyclic phosphodiesterase
MIFHRRRRIMIDCGEDWLGRVASLRPHAIILTHGHPDHAGGLRDGAPCPVYANDETWRVITHYPIGDRRTFSNRRQFSIHGVCLRAIPVEHSIRCPAVAFRIQKGAAFYVPDVAGIPDVKATLRGVGLYIGDGASVMRPIIRAGNGRVFGHASIRTQLDWCAEAGVPRAIFTHCGTGIVDGDERRLGPLVRRLGRERGVEAGIAHDNLAFDL